MYPAETLDRTTVWALVILPKGRGDINSGRIQKQWGLSGALPRPNYLVGSADLLANAISCEVTGAL